MFNTISMNPFNLHLSHIIALAFSLLCGFCEAQTYYGKGNFGRLEMLNDSTCTICFIISPNITNSQGGKLTDTCSLVKSGDTLYISTRERFRFKAAENYSDDFLEDNPTVYKLFKKSYGDDYQLVYEGGCYLYGKFIRFSDLDGFKNGDLIVFRNYVMYDRFIWVYGEDTHILIDNLVDGCCLDRFPLLIKGNKLIPIDKEKNEQCWIDNGFYFPTMKRSNKTKSFDVTPRWSLGLNGLPSGFSFPSNKQTLQGHTNYNKYCKHRK